MLYAILLAGGTGSRMGLESPKQYLQLCGRPVISYSLSILNDHPLIDSLVIVAAAPWRSLIQQWMEGAGKGKFLAFTDPGETRQLSIWNALQIIRQGRVQPDTVLIHDAARPLFTKSLLDRCIMALPGHDGVMPMLPAKDTFYLTDGRGRVTQLLNRSALAAGQSPEVFTFKKYYEAHLQYSQAELAKFNGSTEIAVAKGMDVVTVEGEERNIKLTTANDMVLAAKYLEERD